MLGSRKILVTLQRTPVESRQIGGGHSRNVAPTPFVRQHLVHRRGRQQAASLGQAKVTQRHDRFQPPVRLPRKQRGKGMQLPHSSPSARAQLVDR